MPHPSRLANPELLFIIVRERSRIPFWHCPKSQKSRGDRDTPRLEVDPIEFLPQFAKPMFGKRPVIRFETPANQLALMPNHRIVSA
jgi:hypothetical protein